MPHCLKAKVSITIAFSFTPLFYTASCRDMKTIRTHYCSSLHTASLSLYIPQRMISKLIPRVNVCNCVCDLTWVNSYMSVIVQCVPCVLYVLCTLYRCIVSSVKLVEPLCECWFGYYEKFSEHTRHKHTYIYVGTFLVLQCKDGILILLYEYFLGVTHTWKTWLEGFQSHFRHGTVHIFLSIPFATQNQFIGKKIQWWQKQSKFIKFGG